jgi:hypothetical protein
MTAAKTYKRKADAIKEQVCELLSITDYEYAEKQYLQGVAYLYWHLPNEPILRMAFERSKIYWTWWKMMWVARDEVFINHAAMMSSKVRHELYQELHAACNLSREIKPSKAVTTEVFKPIKKQYESI